jgi:hypothetical protein
MDNKESKISIEDAYLNFPIILEKRLNYSRKNNNMYLSDITYNLLTYFFSSNESVYLKKLLDKKIEKILDDCEIYFNMDKNHAYDAMRELSSLATVYVIDYENPHIYYNICNLIKNIRVSYPIE